MIEGFEKFQFEKSPERERELTPGEIREKLKDPSYLPSRKEIFKAFYVEKPEGVDHFRWRFFGEGERAFLEWRYFCDREEDPVFEFWNKEYIEALSNYLEQRAKELGAAKEKPIFILEVGAGNGRFTHFLKEQFKEKKIENIKIIATDSGKLEIKPHFQVEKIDYREALEKHKPDIVISSWMPLKEDWTKDFRACESVKEYILIGERDDGCCGHPWHTWGADPEDRSLELIEREPPKIREMLLKIYEFDYTIDKLRYNRERKDIRKLTEDEEKILEKLWVKREKLIKNLSKERLKEGIAYKKDGFERYNLDEMRKFQICRSDEFPEGRAFHSSTVSFRREIPPKEKVEK